MTNTSSKNHTILESMQIISFVIEGIAATINQENATIDIALPYGMNLTSLTPAISVPIGASVYPENKTEMDFTNPVIYTVCPPKGVCGSQSYVVNVRIASTSMILSNRQNTIWVSAEYAGSPELIVNPLGNENDLSGLIHNLLPGGVVITSMGLVVSSGEAISDLEVTFFLGARWNKKYVYITEVLDTGEIINYMKKVNQEKVVITVKELGIFLITESV